MSEQSFFQWDQEPGQSAANLSAAEQFLKTGQQAYRRHISPGQSQPCLDEALNAYAQGLELDPYNVALMVGTAQALLRKGQYEKAVRWADRALEYQPDHNDAHDVLGQVATKAGRFDDAVAHLTCAVRFGGLKSAKTRMILARAFRDAARPGLVSGIWQGFTYLAHAGYYMLSGLLLLPLEKERLSVKEMSRIFPALIEGHIHVSRKNYRDALKIYLRLHEAYPGMTGLMTSIAELYARTNASSEALYWYRKCLERHPGHEEARYQLAQQLEEMQRYEEARDLYETLLETRPNDAFIYCHLGNVYFSLEQYPESLTYYESALHLGRRQCEEPEWRSLLAQSIGNLQAEYLNNPGAAQAAYAMAIDLNPREVENYIQLGLSYFQDEDYQNARVVYESAIKVAPTHAKLYSNLGYLCWITGDIKGAVPFYEKATELNPHYDIPYNNLGVIYLDALGDIPKAIELLEKTISVNENYALAYYNLGRAYSFINQSLKAADCFQMAQKLNRYTCELDNEELDARINFLFTAQPQQEAS